MRKPAIVCSVSALALASVCWLAVTVCAQGLCFDPAVDYAAAADARFVFAADLDGDQDQDLAVTDWPNNRVAVLKNNGSGVYAAPVYYATLVNPYSVFAADLDADGDQDMAVGNCGSNNVSVLTNHGDGTFTMSANYTVGDGPLFVVAADLNGDGHKDLVSANYPGGFVGGNVSVLINNGNGTFATAVNYAAGDAPISIAAADLDGDGDQDLAAVNLASSDVSILKNNGGGTFAASINYAVGVNPAWVTAADLDADGDNDLVVANNTSPNISILLNNGNGTFAASVDYPVNTRPWSVVTADFDGDGDYDIAATIPESYVVSVLGNNGNGTFASAVNFSTGGSSSMALIAADLDGNTTCDLAVSNGLHTTASVLLNCRTPCVPSPADMVLWLPLDEGTAGPSANLAAPFHGSQHGSLTNALGKVAGALNFDGVSSYVEVSPYPEIFTNPDPGTSDFSIEAWVQRGAGDNGVRVIAEKRANPAPDTYVGFSFYMYDGRLGLQLANGAYSGWNTLPGEIVPPAGWHHVAVTVDRDNPSGGKFYVDGRQLGSSFDPTVRSGSLSSNAPFCVGSMSFSVSSVFRGDIDEVTMFSRSLGYLEIQALYAAQNYGKCKTYCLCPFHSDFDTDGFMTSLDLSEMIDILFAGHSNVQAPYCPCPRADFDCDLFPTSLDLSALIDHLFAGGPPPCDPCAP